MSKITIPPEAVEAGLREFYVVVGMGGTLSDAIRACFLAMIEAWPGMWVLHQTDEDYIPPRHDLILPLPKEATNG